MLSLPPITMLLRNWVIAFFVFTFFVTAAWPTWARTPEGRVCSSGWFAAERKTASAKQRTFQLLEGGLFSQNENSYALAVGHQAGADGNLDFMVFAAPNQSLDFRLVLTEKFDIVDTGLLSAEEDECFRKGAGVFFKVSVVDLAGNGNQQIVLESNSVGTCATCLSEVRVYQAEKKEIIKVVDEYYNDIKFSKGQGLWVGSFRTSNGGQIVPVEKVFFGAKKPQREAR